MRRTVCSFTFLDKNGLTQVLDELHPEIQEINHHSAAGEGDRHYVIVDWKNGKMSYYYDIKYVEFNPEPADDLPF